MNIVQKIAIYISLIFISINGITAQDCADGMNNLTWEFQIVTQPVGAPLLPGQPFFIECYVTGFVDIIAFQYTLSFNPNVIEFDYIDNLGSELIGPVTEGSGVETGSLPIIWTNGNGEPQSIADGPIFKIFMTVVGDPNDCSDWMITTNSADYEVAFEYPDGTSCTESFADAIQELTGGDLCVECGTMPSLITNGCGNDLEVSFCGGTGPYMYEISGPGLNDSGTVNENEIINYTGLDDGSYLIIVTDAAGQGIPFDETEIVISNAAPLATQINIVNNIACANGDGDLMAMALGGVMPYTFEWSNGVFSENAENLVAGEYTVTVTDANGCTAESDAITLGVTPMEVTSLQVVGATCLGSFDGSVTIIVEGGTPINGTDYTFGNFGESQVGLIENLNPGMYSINVFDESNCLLVVDFEIPALTTGDYDIINEVPIDCFGDFAQLNIAGDFMQPAPGFFPTIVNLNPSPYNPLIAGPNPMTGNLDFLSQEIGVPGNIPGLAPGEYLITFYTIDGCQIQVEYTVAEEPEIIIDVVTEESPDCDGNAGHITVLIDGGTGALTPTWNMGGPGLDFDVTVGGTYTLVVTDESMCTNSVSIDIAEAGSLGLMTNVISGVGCGAAANSGSVEATITGGGNNITYNWENSIGEVLGSEAELSGIGVGTYFVTVTDVDMDCSQEGEVTVDGSGTFVFNPDITPLNCFGGSDAAIEMSISGGASPYMYAWSHDPSLSFNLASNLTGGSYTVTVTDSDQCALDTTIVIESPEQMLISLIDSEAVSCFNGMDGFATASTIDNANGATEFTYFWELAEDNTTVEQFTGDIGEATELPPGEIQVYSVANNCFSDTITFTIPNVPQIEIDTLNSLFAGPSCKGFEDGTIDLIAVGGTSSGTYGFDWDIGESGSAISGLEAGDYIVSVSDDNGCIEVFDFPLIEPDSFQLMLNNSFTVGLSCFGENQAQLGVFPSGGTGPDFTYEWTPAVSTESSADSLSAGEYTIIATDELGCTAEFEYEILSSTPIVLESIEYDPIPCNSGTTDVCLEVSGGTGFGYMYQYNFSETIPIDSCLNTTFGPANISITDSEGCPYIGDIIFDIPQPDPIDLDLTNGVDLGLGEGLELELGDTSFVIDPVITSPNPIDSYFWSSESDDWECFDPDCLSISVFPTEPTIYALEVIDSEGCTATADILVEVKKERKFFAPNIFTPDGDGMDEIFHPFTGKGVTMINEWKIYDRWGNEMHTAENILPGEEILYAWDGRFQGIDAAPGVYVYIAEVEFVDDVVLFFKGSITLLR